MKLRGDTQGEANPNAKLTEAQALEVIDLLTRRFAMEVERQHVEPASARADILRTDIERLSNAALGKRFGVKRQTISRILHSHAWAHLPRPYKAMMRKALKERGGVRSHVVSRDQQRRIQAHATARRNVNAAIVDARQEIERLEAELQLMRDVLRDAEEEKRAVGTKADLAKELGLKAWEITHTLQRLAKPVPTMTAIDTERRRQKESAARTFEELQAEAIALEKVDTSPEERLLRATYANRRKLSDADLDVLAAYDDLCNSCNDRAREHEIAALRERRKAAQFSHRKMADKFQVSISTIQYALRAIPNRRKRYRETA